MAVNLAPTEVQKWLDCISGYERTFKKWESRVDKIIKRYRDERSERETGRRYNILHSNVQTLSAATFSKLPKPDVSRRFHDQDQVGRVASLIIERGLEYEVQHYPDYRSTLKQDILDRFLGGRGQAWVRYEPHMRAVESSGAPVDGVEITEDVSEPEEELDYECAPLDYVHWRDFGHVVARTWEEVPAVWRWVYLTRGACVERFGEDGEKIPLDASPEEIRRQRDSQSNESRAKICEIWDKEAREALWLSPSLNKILDRRKQGKGAGELTCFDGFFPCPKPLFATLTNESLVPVPDFTLYQDQANELDILADRIDGLVKALKVQGVYDATQIAVGRLFTEGENASLIPVKDWAAFSEKNGLKGTIDIIDLDPFGRALKECYLAFAQIKAHIDELTGISDIIRGETNASETATAQQIKSQYASLRLKDYQNDVAYFATELLRLKAQVMCQKFSDETLAMIAAVDQLTPEDQKLVPQAFELIRNDKLRSFRVEVAADSLIYLDEQQEKKDRVELLTAAGSYIQQVAQGLKGMDPRYAATLVPLLMSLLKFGVAGFRAGKTIEAEFVKAADQLAQIALQPAPPPPPDPKIQSDKELEQARVMADAQIENNKLQQQEIHHQREMAHEAGKASAQVNADRERALMEQDTDLKKAAMEIAGKIEIARLGAQAQAETASQEAQVEGQQASDSQRGFEQILQAVMAGQEKLLEVIAAPKKRDVIRDEMGRVKTMVEGPA